MPCAGSINITLINDGNETVENKPLNVTSSSRELTTNFPLYAVVRPFLFHAAVFNETIRGTNIDGNSNEA